MFKHAGSVDRVAQAFGIKTQEIIARESYFLSGRKTKNVDISDVLKAVPIQWVATEIVSHTSISFLCRELKLKWLVCEGWSPA